MEKLPGITYTVDEQNDRAVLVLDLKRYRDLWEDLFDAILAEVSREDADYIPLAEFEKQLKEEGKL